MRDVVVGFWRGVVKKGVKGWLEGEEIEDDEDWVKVKEIDFGRR